MGISIIIIGGGASGVALLANIVDKLITANLSGWNVLVIERNKDIGPGMAYGTTCDCNLLNTPAGSMGIYPDKPRHFLEWLSEHPEKWKKEFPSVSISDFSTPPRRLYGLYLKHIAGETAILANRHQGSVDFLHESVIDVDLTDDGGVVHLKASPPIQAKFIIFAIGAFESCAFPSLIGKKGYFNSPYPEKKLLTGIPKESTVYVIGSRLSAIDAILTLKSHNHRGKITCISREGLWPCVQGGHKEYARRYLTKGFLEKIAAHHKGKLPLASLLYFAAKEIAFAEEKTFRWSRLPHTRSRGLHLLRYEISQSHKQSFRPWQIVLHSLNDLLNFTWERLDEEDRDKVVKQLLGVFLTYRAAMPIENAEQIYSLTKSKELELLSGFQSITHDEEKKCFWISSKTTRGHFTKTAAEFVINATGPSADISKAKDPLIQRLIQKGTLASHSFGGVKMDPLSLNLIDAKGRLYPYIFVVGSLATGVHLVTNLLEYIVRVSSNVASCIPKQIGEKRAQNF